MNAFLLAADLGDFLSTWYGILLFAVIDIVIAVIIVAVTYRWVFKYVFDFLAGLVAAIVTSPVWLVVIALSRVHMIKTNEYKHLFARRTVAGRGGKRIVLHSFTVKDDLNGEYTRLGEILHKTGIEKLPIVFDLLLLRVSLVGVRPLSVVDEKFVSGEDYARFSARPGFVNPALLYAGGKKELSYADMFESDARYAAEKYGFFVDIAVLVTLLVRKIRGERAALTGEPAEKSYAEILFENGEISAADYAAALAEEGLPLPAELKAEIGTETEAEDSSAESDAPAAPSDGEVISSDAPAAMSEAEAETLSEKDEESVRPREEE